MKRQIMHAVKVLELAVILERLAKHCQMPLGAARAEALIPLFDDDSVWELQAQTAEAYQALSRDSVPPLSRVLDLRKPLDRARKGGTLGGQELFEVAELLSNLRGMKQFLSPRKQDWPRLWGHTEFFPEEPKVEARLLESLEPNGDLKDSASPELGTIRRRARSMTGKIVERIQSYVSGKAREYLSDPIFTVRDGRYVIPVKSEHRGKIKGIIHDTSGSGQTVYIEPEDVLQVGNQIRELEAAEREEIQRILFELSAVVGKISDVAIPAIPKAAELDLILAKARLAFEMHAGAPIKARAHSIKIDSGRHPLLDSEKVVPVSLEVGREFDGLLITGPNTGGKTVAIKCVGLFVLMIQCGLMIPARNVEFGVFSQVLADIGDEQSISQSLSTFSGHIRNISEALKTLKPGALVLFDEIGAGTDPSEGAALAKVLLRRFQQGGARVIASTHYGELKAFAYSEPGFQNAAMEFDAKSLSPTYRVLLGAPGASHALKIAERYGIPSSLIEEAKQAQGEQDRDMADMLEKLEQAQRQARSAQSQADRRAQELKQAEDIAQRKLAEADEIRRSVHAKATETIESALREIRLQATEIFDTLKESGGSQANIEKARAELKALQNIGEEVAAEYRAIPDKRTSKEVPLEKGAHVRVEGYTQTGVLLENPKSGSALVQMGPLRITVSVQKLTAFVSAQPLQIKSKKPSTVKLAQSATTEIHVRGLRAEEALERVERFVDDAVLAGIHQVRIVHGKGEGILRKLIHDYLKRHRGISTFREGEPAEGGAGATIAVIK